MHFDNRVTGDSHVSKTEKNVSDNIDEIYLFHVEFRVYTHLHVLLFDHTSTRVDNS